MIMDEVSVAVSRWMGYAKQVGIHEDVANTTDDVIHSYGMMA